MHISDKNWERGFIDHIKIVHIKAIKFMCS